MYGYHLTWSANCLEFSYRGHATCGYGNKNSRSKTIWRRTLGLIRNKVSNAFSCIGEKFTLQKILEKWEIMWSILKPGYLYQFYVLICHHKFIDMLASASFFSPLYAWALEWKAHVKDPSSFIHPQEKKGPKPLYIYIHSRSFTNCMSSYALTHKQTKKTCMKRF